MENNEFQHISELWKKAAQGSTSRKVYSEKDINKFKMKKSIDLTRSLQKSLLFDVAFKGILIAAVVLLIVLYQTNAIMITALIMVSGISLLFMYFENIARKQFFDLDNYSKDLQSVLHEKITFYKHSFPKIKWMVAFTNALFVWIGSLFYFYNKYGYYRIESVADILVSAIMVSLAFGISYVAITFQYKYYIQELEECLTDLNDEQAAAVVIANQQRRKKLITIGAILAIIIGLVLLIFFIIN
jgi:divalent metal cation (Fe/Co/Zn/Cd) transporter